MSFEVKLKEFIISENIFGILLNLNDNSGPFFISINVSLTLVLPSLFCNMVYQGGGGYHPLWTWNWRTQSMIVWYHGIG